MNRIKDVIKEKGFTITSLATVLGIQRESLSRALVSPSYSTLEKIASALKVPMWQLFASESEVQKESVGNTIRCPKCNHEFKVKLEVEKEPSRT